MRKFECPGYLEHDVLGGRGVLDQDEVLAVVGGDAFAVLDEAAEVAGEGGVLAGQDISTGLQLNADLELLTRRGIFFLSSAAVGFRLVKCATGDRRSSAVQFSF
jgi:hypothetical protein